MGAVTAKLDGFKSCLYFNIYFLKVLAMSMTYFIRSKKIIFLLTLSFHTTTKAQQYKIYTIQEITNPEPYQSNQPLSEFVNSLLFKKLFNLSNDELFRSDVFDWIQNQERKKMFKKPFFSFQVQIKENLFWNNGKPIQFEDIRHSLNVAKMHAKLSAEKKFFTELDITKSKNIPLNLNQNSPNRNDIITFNIPISNTKDLQLLNTIYLLPAPIKQIKKGEKNHEASHSIYTNHPFVGPLKVLQFKKGSYLKLNNTANYRSNPIEVELISIKHAGILEKKILEKEFDLAFTYGLDFSSAYRLIHLSNRNKSSVRLRANNQKKMIKLIWQNVQFSNPNLLDYVQLIIKNYWINHLPTDVSSFYTTEPDKKIFVEIKKIIKDNKKLEIYFIDKISLFKYHPNLSNLTAHFSSLNIKFNYISFEEYKNKKLEYNLKQKKNIIYSSQSEFREEFQPTFLTKILDEQYPQNIQKIISQTEGQNFWMVNYSTIINSDRSKEILSFLKEFAQDSI